MRFLLVLFCLIPVSVQAQLSVVASIRPLYQITSALMQGAGDPVLLIDNSESAHHFSFRPSHFRTLQQADLVIWIDRRFESGFQQLAQVLSKRTRQLELIPTLGLSAEDGHIWYSPELLMLISTEISRALAELDPENQPIYQRNLVVFQQMIEDWQRQVGQTIIHLQPAFILDHDFLHHFEAAFELESVASIHDGHDQHSGISSLQAIEEKLRNSQISCIISYENSVSRTAGNLAEKFSLSIQSLESFANDGDPATRFIRHLQYFTNILRNCSTVKQ